MSYSRDRQWSETFIPAIRQIVGPLLLEAAPIELDVAEATDLIVLRARDMRIAARMRHSGYFTSYGAQFTIRCQRDTGAKTELAKVVDGWGDWLFYGHASDDDSSIEHWMLIDLSAFRAALIRSNMNSDSNNKIITGRVPNGDGTYFAWFDIRSFGWCEPPLLIAASPSVHQLEAIR